MCLRSPPTTLSGYLLDFSYPRCGLVDKPRWFLQRSLYLLYGAVHYRHLLARATILGNIVRKRRLLIDRNFVLVN